MKRFFNINDADYAQAKGVCKDFEIKNTGEYHGYMFKGIYYC